MGVFNYRAVNFDVSLLFLNGVESILSAILLFKILSEQMEYLNKIA